MTLDLIVAAGLLCFCLGYWIARYLHSKVLERANVTLAAKDAFIEKLRDRLASREYDQRSEP